MLLEVKVSDFGLCVFKVRMRYNGNNPIEFANLVNQYHKISLERMKQEVQRIFCTAVRETDPVPDGPFQYKVIDPANNLTDKELFYKRVDSQVVAEWIKNTVSNSDYLEMMSQKKDFAFRTVDDVENYDVPTMLWIILKKVNPSIVVGVEVYCNKLKKIRMHEFNNDINAICNRKLKNSISSSLTIRAHARALLAKLTTLSLLAPI